LRPPRQRWQRLTTPRISSSFAARGRKDFKITYKADGTFSSTFIPKGGKWRISKGSLIQENPSALGDFKTVVVVSSYRVTAQQLILTRIVNSKQYRNEYKRVPMSPDF
jgi:hypothetical protein